MRTFARRHPIAAFLVLSYAAAAVIFAVPLLSSAGVGAIDLELPGATPFVLVVALALTGAAFVTTALAEGREGVHDLRRRTFRFRVNPGWFVVGLLLLPITALAAALPIAGLDPILALVTRPDVLLGTLVAGALIAFLLVNWWEEVAWTGFALHRLQGRIGPIAASVVTTWLQAIVHLPLVFVADGVTVGRVPPAEIPIYLVALFVLPIPVRIVLSWLYNVTGRSLPVVGLYHAGLGVATGGGFLPVLAPGIAPLVAYAGFAALAAVVLGATGGRLGLRSPESTSVAGPAAAVATHAMDPAKEVRS
jgi:membrane protease YdiL (CAAX protease family)